MSTYELEQDVRAEIIERADELKESPYPSDLLFELADSHVPIYNHELASCLADDPGLAFVDNVELVDASKGVYRIIQVAIYARLIQSAHEAFDSLPDADELEDVDLIPVVKNMSAQLEVNLGATL